MFMLYHIRFTGKHLTVFPYIHTPMHTHTRNVQVQVYVYQLSRVKAATK